MTIDDILSDGAPPVVAILRGVTSGDVVAIGETLVATGIRLIEVPLNSPDPFASVARLAEAVGSRALVGAGTVLTVEHVDAVSSAGGRLIVTPNTNPAVIEQAVAEGLEPMPGFATPSEAFTAYAAGARRLKLFPAGPLGIAHLRAIREVLPQDATCWAVGGTSVENFREWLDAGAEGIGVGGALYRPGDSTIAVRRRATALVEAWREWGGPRPR